MKNVEAFGSVLSTVALADRFVREGIEDNLHEINTALIRWSRLPQLERLGEVVVKAMLEAHPSNVRVQRMAVAHLTRVGRMLEASKLERGELPKEVEIWTDEQERRRAEEGAAFILELELAARGGKA